MIDRLVEVRRDVAMARDDGYRAGYMAGHADALDSLAHLIRRGVADPLARLRRWHWKHLRPWGEGLIAGERPDFCRRDRHGEHYEADDDDEA